MKMRADWAAWILQFLFGSIVGAGISLAFTPGLRRRSDTLIDREDAMMFLLGTVLIGGGLASYLGDRLWLDGVYRFSQPEAARHSMLSRILSILFTVAGLVLLITAIMRSLER